MRKLLYLFLLAFVAPIHAQNNRVDVFVGIDYFHNGALPKTASAVPSALRGSGNMPGLTGELSINANRWFGFVGDVSFQRSSTENLFMLTGGPELSLRVKGNRFFVHGLIGGAYEAKDLKSVKFGSLSDSSFNAGLGGGLDLGWKHFAFRLFQADYFYTPVFNTSEQNFRLATGFVFKL